MFKQAISESVWNSTYKWETETSVTDLFNRLTTALVDNFPNEDREFLYLKFHDLLSNFKYVFGGRINSNLGLDLKGTTLINCFVDGFFGTSQDSLPSIMATVARCAEILKSEGGYGCNIDVIRPRGSYIRGNGVESCGPIPLLELWNTTSSVITEGSGIEKGEKGKNKIRKGAMMVTMSLWNPSIIEFIKAKQTPNTLTKFNMSVLASDEFFTAVREDKEWEFVFPDTTIDEYDQEWDGNLDEWKSKGYPIKVWGTIPAKELWDTIMTSTYNRNEPGILFIDVINQLNNLYYTEFINSPNACGEQPMPKLNSCNLGHINLVHYTKADSTGYDLEKLDKDLPYMLMMQDSIIDLTKYPLPDQEVEAKSKRRVGMGYMGYGSSLYLLKIPYGSKKALSVTDEVAKFVTNRLYQESSVLAKKLGSFEKFDKEKFLKSKFIAQALTLETIEMISQNGMRNSHLTTIAPTGNGGIFANNVSGGLEPVIEPEYWRTLIVSAYDKPESLVIPDEIDWDRRKCESLGKWKWIKEGDDNLLFTKFNTVNYKFDKQRGLTKEEKVLDYAVLEMGDDFDENADYVRHISNLSVSEHLDTMTVFAKYIDSAISKTLNVPEDYSYEDFKNIYLDAYDSGVIKGFTTYRWGTMANVVSKTSTGIVEAYAPIRPDVLPCDVHRITVHGEKWLVFVGKLNGIPYEVFSGKIDVIDLSPKVKEGCIVKIAKRKYGFEYNDELVVPDLSAAFNNAIHDGLTRMISYSLRYGVPIVKLVGKLNESKGTITDFSKAITRALKKYIKDGESNGSVCPNCKQQLTFIEGCEKCLNCGHSAC